MGARRTVVVHVRRLGLDDLVHRHVSHRLCSWCAQGIARRRVGQPSVMNDRCVGERGCVGLVDGRVLKSVWRAGRQMVERSGQGGAVPVHAKQGDAPWCSGRDRGNRTRWSTDRGYLAPRHSMPSGVVLHGVLVETEAAGRDGQVNKCLTTGSS